MDKLFLKMILGLLIFQLSGNVSAMQPAEYVHEDLSREILENIIFSKVLEACSDLENIHQNAQSKFNDICCMLKEFVARLSAKPNNQQSMQLLESLKTQEIMQSIFARCLNFVSEDDVKKAILEAVFQRDEWSFFFAVCLPNNNPNAVYTKKYKATSLHFAAGCGFVYALTALLRAGARVNQVDTYNLTPLHFASLRGLDLCMGLLIEAGANQKAEDVWGRTPHACYGVGLQQVPNA